jgi:hypothetical protein
MKDEIETSVSYNMSELYDRTNWKHKLAINFGLGLIGVAVFWHYSGVLAFVGLVWAIINWAPIATWAVGV